MPVSSSVGSSTKDNAGSSGQVDVSGGLGPCWFPILIHGHLPLGGGKSKAQRLPRYDVGNHNFIRVVPQPDGITLLLQGQLGCIIVPR